MQELRRRTAEIEAWADLERRREQQDKEVELRPRRRPAVGALAAQLVSNALADRLQVDVGFLLEVEQLAGLLDLLVHVLESVEDQVAHEPAGLAKKKASHRAGIAP